MRLQKGYTDQLKVSGPKKVDSSLVRFFKSCWYISKSYTFFKREQIPNPQRSFEIVPLFFWKDSTSIGFYILLIEDCCMHMKVDWKRKNSAKKEHQILYLKLFIILSSCLEDKSSHWFGVIWILVQILS